jgi:hypothetical protein
MESQIMNTFTSKLVRFLFPQYVMAWESYADNIESYVRELETENIELRYGKIKTKRINDDLAIGMLPGFTSGTKDLVPVMDSEGNIDLLPKDQTYGNYVPEIEVSHDDTVKVVTHDVMDYILGRVQSKNKSNGNKNQNQSNSKNQNGNKNKSNGNKNHTDSGAFASADPFASDSPFWELVEQICDQYGYADSKLPKDQFDWLKTKYPNWLKNPVSNEDYLKRFTDRFPA